jgi:hypothetical protein
MPNRSLPLSKFAPIASRTPTLVIPQASCEDSSQAVIELLRTIAVTCTRTNLPNLVQLSREKWHGRCFRRKQTAAQLLHATLQMGYSGPTETLPSQTKYWDVGVYESGRLN